MPKLNKIKRKRVQNAKRLNQTLQKRKIAPEEPTSNVEPIKVKDGDNLVSLRETPNNELPQNMEFCNFKRNIAVDETISNFRVSKKRKLAPEEPTSNYIEHITVEDFDDVKSIAETPNEELPPNIQFCKSNNEQSIIGRRILNVPYFFSELQKLAQHGPFQCGLSSIKLISEKRNGLRSLYKFVCRMCHEKFYINGDDNSALEINKSAVASSVAIGIGHSQLNELFANMDLPLLSSQTYDKQLKFINKKWEEEFAKSTKEAAEDERRIAIKEGRVDKDGIPLIDVIADGCWGKRSYQKNYSSLSGAAAIIGRRTGKILFMGVKNKYCCVCSKAANKNLDAKEHNCYKNYTGPSTGMESTILVEGFKKSIEIHNLIYARLISDGDASTYAKLLQARPYPNVTVEKIECRNHLFRNLCNKLQLLTTDRKYLIKFRKLITKKRILTIRRTIVKAISQHEDTKNVEALHADIMLAADHAFGIHSRCKQYFCYNVGENDGVVEIELFTNSIWHRIMYILTHIAAHARSLIQNVDSNIVERYNSLVAKFVGGKRVNFSLRFQYQMRCTVAALSFNTYKPLSLLHKSILGKSPSGQIQRFEARKIKRMKLSSRIPRKKRRLFQETVASNNYGENCLKPDMMDDMFHKSKNIFLKSLEKTPQERDRIARETVLQSGSSEWLELRRRLLTASNFGRVIKRRMDVSCANIVKDLLYKKNISHVKSIKHGIDNELAAKKQLEEQESIKINDCGLYIDEEFPFLGATPDGIVDNLTIVEIKCPVTSYKTGLSKAIEEKKFTFYKKLSDGSLVINKEHNWWYQIQGQLHIAKKSQCILGIWCGENVPIKVETIVRDDQFWEIKMKNKLINFYMDCILPELVDPRNTRSMPIREPDYIIKAIELKTRKKQEKENARKKHEKENTREIETDLGEKRDLIAKTSQEKSNKRYEVDKNILREKNICRQRQLDYEEF